MIRRRRRRVRRLRLRLRWRLRRGRLGVRVVRHPRGWAVRRGRVTTRRVFRRRPGRRVRRLRRRRQHRRYRPVGEGYRRARPAVPAGVTRWRARPRRVTPPAVTRAAVVHPRGVRPSRRFTRPPVPTATPAGHPRRPSPPPVRSPRRGDLTVFAHFGNLYLGRLVRTVRAGRPPGEANLFGRPPRGVHPIRPRPPAGVRFRPAPPDGRPRRRRRRRWLRRRFWRPARRGGRRNKSPARLVGLWWCRRRWWRRRRGVRRRRVTGLRRRRVVHADRVRRRRRRRRVPTVTPVVFRRKFRYRRRRRGPRRPVRAVRPDVATHLRRLTGLFVRRGRRARAEQLVRRLDRTAGLDLLYRAAHVSLVGYPRTRAGRPVTMVALAPPGRVLARQWYTRAWRRRGEREWTARATAEFVRPTAVAAARTAYLAAAVAGRALL